MKFASLVCSLSYIVVECRKVGVSDVLMNNMVNASGGGAKK